MELILKKAKITASTLKQTYLLDISKIKDFEPIGWCHHDKRIKFIFYDKTKGLLAFLPKVTVGEVTFDNPTEFYVFRITIPSHSHSWVFQRVDKEGLLTKRTLIKSYIAKALDLGQFYY